jgi:hypothetical protein
MPPVVRAAVARSVPLSRRHRLDQLSGSAGLAQRAVRQRDAKARLDPCYELDPFEAAEAEVPLEVAIQAGGDSVPHQLGRDLAHNLEHSAPPVLRTPRSRARKHVASCPFIMFQAAAHFARQETMIPDARSAKRVLSLITSVKNTIHRALRTCRSSEASFLW